MDRGVIWIIGKDGVSMIVSQRWNTDFLLYFTQASPGVCPLLFCTLNYICALGFKELNETHLHIYIYIFIL